MNKKSKLAVFIIVTSTLILGIIGFNDVDKSINGEPEKIRGNSTNTERKNGRKIRCGDYR